MTPKSLALLAVAKKSLGLQDEDWRALLLNYGEKASARELDGRGFAAVMDRCRQLGFVSTKRRATLGERPGMASPGQVTLIRSLWEAVSPDPTDKALNGWLAKYHKVGALRMVSDVKARPIIAALKTWQDRIREKAAQEAAGAVSGTTGAVV